MKRSRSLGARAPRPTLVLDPCPASYRHSRPQCPAWVSGADETCGSFVLFLGFTSAALLHAVILWCLQAYHFVTVPAVTGPAVRSGGDTSTADATASDVAGVAEALGGAVLRVAAMTLFVLLLACAAAGMLSLFAYHLHLIAQNLTTLEAMKGLKHTGNGGIPRVDNIYSLGFAANAAQVFGESPAEWFLWTPVGDGLSFPTRVAPII